MPTNHIVLCIRHSRAHYGMQVKNIMAIKESTNILFAGRKVFRSWAVKVNHIP